MSMCCARVLSATPGISLASVAIRWSRVEMVSGFGVPVIFPSHGSMTRHPLPSAGSPGVGSPASAVLRSAPSPGRPSRRTSFPSLGGTARALDLRSRGMASAPPPSQGCSTGCPSRLSHGDDQASQVPGEPSCVHAPLFDPGELFTPGPPRRVDTAFRHVYDVGARGPDLSGLNPAACTLPVYASQGGSLRHHATLGTGWGATLCRAGLVTRWAPSKGFRDRDHISSPFPRLRLAHRHESRVALLARSGAVADPLPARRETTAVKRPRRAGSRSETVAGFPAGHRRKLRIYRRAAHSLKVHQDRGHQMSSMRVPGKYSSGLGYMTMLWR